MGSNENLVGQQQKKIISFTKLVLIKCRLRIWLSFVWIKTLPVYWSQNGCFCKDWIRELFRSFFQFFLQFFISRTSDIRSTLQYTFYCLCYPPSKIDVYFKTRVFEHCAKKYQVRIISFHIASKKKKFNKVEVYEVFFVTLYTPDTWLVLNYNKHRSYQ